MTEAYNHAIKSNEFEAAEVAGRMVRIPAPLLDAFNGTQAEIAHERMQHAKLTDLKRPSMRFIDGCNSIVGLLHPNDGFVPRENDYDGRRAIVHLYPYGNGLGDHMTLRSRLLQDSLDQPTKVVAFPNNSIGEKYYDFSDKELVRIRRGSLDPLSDKILRALDYLSVEKIDIVGYLQGGSLAANLLKRAKASGTVAVNSVMIGEPPTIYPRAKHELIKDFRSGGLDNFIRAVRDSAIPALEEAQGIANPKQYTKFIRGMAKFALGSKIDKSNRAILHAMSSSTLPNNQIMFDGIQHAPKIDRQNKVFVYGAQSHITPSFAVGRLQPSLDDNFRVIKLPGYGHEAGDNIVVHALLAKIAIEGR